MAACSAAHVQFSHIYLPSATPTPSASPIFNVPGHQTHDHGSSVESLSLPVRHTPGYIDPSSLAEPAPVLQEKGGELRSTCVNSLPPATETDTLLASKRSDPAELDHSSEAVSPFSPIQGFSPGPRSTLDTLTPGRPKPASKSTSKGTSLATRLTNRNKVEKKPPRQVKSRQRTSLTPISSGPKPKAQPSIEPYVPSCSHSEYSFIPRQTSPHCSTGVAEATNTLLLASKSNYQNILNGTIVPGGLYPASFSTALASKRTSHKAAEQERRERLNKALEHMQALVLSSLDEASETGTSDSSAAQASNCKAGRIENATKYIKRLQRQVSERTVLIQARNQEIGRLKRDLAAEGQSSTMDAVEDTTM
jgi:hypothetical protein